MAETTADVVSLNQVQAVGIGGDGWLEDDCKITGPICFAVGAQPVCLTLWGLEGHRLVLWRVAGKCKQFRKDLGISFEEGCPVMVTTCGRYEIRMDDGTETMPESLLKEEFKYTSVDHAALACKAIHPGFQGPI